MLEPEKIEEVLGKAVVQEVFKIPKIGFIAGSKVTQGLIKRNALARIIRDEEQIIYNSKCDDVHMFYTNNLAPYKGEIELWYQNNFSFFIDLKIIILTAWVIFFPKSRYYEYFFEGLPKRKF